MMLATTDDLESRLGRPLDNLEQAEATILDVSEVVILYTGQKFARDDYTLRARVKRGYVRLPQRPVHDVTSVTDRHENELSFDWDGIDRVYIRTRALDGRAPVQVVDITYDAGPETVPSVIVGIVSAISLRAIGVDPTEGAVSQEAVDGYSYTIGSAGGARAYGILPAEAKILDRFARKIGNIQVAW